MHFRAICVCRGSGKVFLLVQTAKIEARHSLVVTADLASGKEVPCSIYPFDCPNPATERHVIVVPMLAASSCWLHLQEVDNEGAVLDSFDHMLSFSAAKWESRVNYRVKSKLSSQIRDFDSVGEYDRAFIEFWDAIEDGDELIVHLLVKLPYYADNELQIECLTADLTPLSVDPIILGNRRAPLPFSAKVHQREIQVSIRVPNVIQRLIFTAKDLAHPQLNSFTVLDGPMLDGLRTETKNRLFPISWDPEVYQDWIKRNFASPAIVRAQRRIHNEGSPSFSIVVPLYETPPQLFQEMYESVIAQSYERWELILVNASPDNKELTLAVRSVAAENTRIRVIELEKNLGISGNTNQGLSVAKGDFVCFLDHDDTIEPDALFEYAEAIRTNPETDLLYSDEDKLDASGRYVNPFFKPDFNLDLLRNVNYICHFLCIRRSLLKLIEPSEADVDGAQDHDLTLKAVERARHVHHVARVLYHWRLLESSTAANPQSKSYASSAAVIAVQRHLHRL